MARCTRFAHGVNKIAVQDGREVVIAKHLILYFTETANTGNALLDTILQKQVTASEFALTLRLDANADVDAEGAKFLNQDVDGIYLHTFTMQELIGVPELEWIELKDRKPMTFRHIASPQDRETAKREEAARLAKRIGSVYRVPQKYLNKDDEQE